MHGRPTHPAAPTVAPLSALLAALALLFTPAAAHAQIEAVTHRWVVVAQDETPLRCGDYERFYPIAQLEEGTPLRVDGEGGGWARVIYPSTVYALLSARDAEPSGRNRARLTRESKLRAANVNPDVGVAGSWRSVYREPLPAGTELTVVETLRNADGDIEGFRVVPPMPPIAPHAPHAYIAMQQVREASLTELAAIVEREGPANPAEVVEPIDPEAAPVTPASEPVAEPISEPAADQPSETPATTPPDAGTPDAGADPDAEPSTSLIEPMIPPAAAGAGVAAAGGDSDDPSVGDAGGAAQEGQPVDATPEPEAPAGGTPADPVVIDQSADRPAIDPVEDPAEDPAGAPAETPVADPADAAGPDTGVASDEPTPVTLPAGAPDETDPAEPETPAPLTLEELEAEFNRVRGLGRVALDDTLDELIGEFERTRATLSEPVLLRLADRRLEWLRFRRDTRDERRELDATLAAVDDRTAAIRERVERLERGRAYALVGRLVPSALYTGERLPLMYRIETVGGPAAPRTLGYIRPRAGDSDLRGKLGQLVGIIGDVRLDRALNLMLVRPVRVDVLAAEGE